MEPCWPLFSLKVGSANWVRGVLCRVFVFFRCLARPDRPLGPIWARFGKCLVPFGANLARFWHPKSTNIRPKNDITALTNPWGFFVGSSFFRFFGRHDPILASFWLHLSAFGPPLGSIWKVFDPIVVPSVILGHLGASACTGWAGGVTRSVKDFIN